MSRTRALLLPALAIVAAVALVACGGGGDDPTPTETATATESTPTPTPTTSRTPSPTATPRPSQTESADAVQAISGLKDFIDGYGYPSDATFAELRVPKLGVDAQVASRFVGGDGVMPNPEGPAEVIWYDMSLWQGMGGVPGGGGNAIFSGHVDYDYAVGYAGVHYRGQGVFSQLGKLVEGDIIEVDSEPYGDSFARPARLLPLEAKALVAAIDLVGDHLPQAKLDTAREKIIEALGRDPAHEGLAIVSESGGAEAARIVNEAIAKRQVLELNYYKENEDKFSERKVEPYRLENGREGWYAECFDLDRQAMRHFKLDRIKDANPTGENFEPRPEAEELAGVEGWMSDGQVPEASVARVWVSPERSRWVREERNVIEELADGAVVVELPYAGTSWLVREILRGAGDLVVLEPQEARDAISRELAA